MSLANPAPPSVHVRRSLRAAVAAVAAVVLSLIPQPNAGAQESLKILASQGNWFWSSNNKITVCQPNPAPPGTGPNGVCQPVSLTGGVQGNAANVASPISTGHMGVSAKDGGSDMRAYVQFDLSSVPLGSKVSSFVMTLTVSKPDQAHTEVHSDRGACGESEGEEPSPQTVGGCLHPPATVNQNMAAIRACAAAEPWGGASGGDGGEPPYATSIADASAVDTTNPDNSLTTIKNEPASDCGISVLGTKSADGSTWRFDLTRMAQAWATGALFNNGLALLPEMRGNEPTWQVEFHGPVTTRLDDDGNRKTLVDATEAASAIIEFEPAEIPPPPPTFTPPVSPPVAGGNIPVPSFGNPEPTTPTVTPPPVTNPGPVVPVASTGTTPWYAWAMLPLGILGLGLVSTAVGPDGLVSATASNRVAGVLRQRRLNAGAPSDASAFELGGDIQDSGRLEQ